MKITIKRLYTKEIGCCYNCPHLGGNGCDHPNGPPKSDFRSHNIFQIPPKNCPLPIITNENYKKYIKHVLSKKEDMDVDVIDYIYGDIL
jgi:hypothetical protein